MALDPRGLTDRYADYWQQNVSHALINRAHCLRNPHGFKGYGADCWGLTASDDPEGYRSHAPDNDNGVISPTAALASFPYTPEHSMRALRHFYHELGDRIWGDYGFTDAFDLTTGLVRAVPSRDRPGPDHRDDRELPQRPPLAPLHELPGGRGGAATLGFPEPALGRGRVICRQAQPAVQGLISVRPRSSKSLTLRVASAARRAAAMPPI